MGDIPLAVPHRLKNGREISGGRQKIKWRLSEKYIFIVAPTASVRRSDADNKSRDFQFCMFCKHWKRVRYEGEFFDLQLQTTKIFDSTSLDAAVKHFQLS